MRGKLLTALQLKGMHGPWLVFVQLKDIQPICTSCLETGSLMYLSDCIIRLFGRFSFMEQFFIKNLIKQTSTLQDFEFFFSSHFLFLGIVKVSLLNLIIWMA
ncbi:hypothetical protein PRUPE_6G243300 [Prunus persica]|uniref:Uncharacterized protein n=1 Tax=Prunus persica TaxID=3760 RepID=M5W4T4_PRUPE|nr:hypothetical protein PRUPE_6G243300 [Prunus persica]